ncbi:FYDLN acid domain-containing protein [Pikeienuella sp. HZG-20]|uniref:FYDLN acid domain-containing protein n=1 Tax=Paludibacillus litoralis TaxID=3133267 RepID=UPI0030EFA2B3
MPKDEWGVKRLCAACGVRFYDLGRDPVDCPSCGETYTPPVSTVVKSRVSKATAKKTADDVEDDDDDLDVIEKDDDDDDDLDIIGKDDDDDDVDVAPKGVIPGDDDDEDDDEVPVIDDEADEDDEADDDDALLPDDDDDDDLGEFSKVDTKHKDI